MRVPELTRFRVRCRWIHSLSLRHGAAPCKRERDSELVMSERLHCGEHFSGFFQSSWRNDFFNIDSLSFTASSAWRLGLVMMNPTRSLRGQRFPYVIHIVSSEDPVQVLALTSSHSSPRKTIQGVLCYVLIFFVSVLDWKTDRCLGTSPRRALPVGAPVTGSTTHQANATELSASDSS